jgi:hypothetical protein
VGIVSSQSTPLLCPPRHRAHKVWHTRVCVVCRHRRPLRACMKHWALESVSADGAILSSFSGTIDVAMRRVDTDRASVYMCKKFETVRPNACSRE